MIQHLDQLLRDLFVGGIAEIGDEMQVRFQPPDQAWVSYVNTLTDEGRPVNALNVYLVELRENRRLRTNQLARAVGDGFSVESQAPMRMDCHYLITAWSPATVTPALEPSWDEHRLLYAVTSLLANSQPLVPSAVYASTNVPADFPAELVDAELPVEFVAAEGFPKYAEFWGTMGSDQVWRPAIQLVITLPVFYLPSAPVPVVTTRVTSMRIGEDDAGQSVQIGGQVLDAIAPGPDGSPALVEGAWVMLETLSGERLKLTRTDVQGQFDFGRIQPDHPPETYRLRAQGTGYTDVVREVTIPSPSGEFDLLFR